MVSFQHASLLLLLPPPPLQLAVERELELDLRIRRSIRSDLGYRLVDAEKGAEGTEWEPNQSRLHRLSLSTLLTLKLTFLPSLPPLPPAYSPSNTHTFPSLPNLTLKKSSHQKTQLSSISLNSSSSLVPGSRSSEETTTRIELPTKEQKAETFEESSLLFKGLAKRKRSDELGPDEDGGLGRRKVVGRKKKVALLGQSLISLFWFFGPFESLNEHADMLLHTFLPSNCSSVLFPWFDSPSRTLANSLINATSSPPSTSSPPRFPLSLLPVRTESQQ